MCLTVDMELTREVRELLEERGKVVVYKRPLLLPSVDPERRSIRSETRPDFVWREEWNEAGGGPPVLRAPRVRRGIVASMRRAVGLPNLELEDPTVREGDSLGAGVFHAWLHKPQQDDEYLMGLEGHAEHFVAAGVFGARDVHVAFTKLYLPMAELERVSKLEIATTSSAQLGALGATLGQGLPQPGFQQQRGLQQQGLQVGPAARLAGALGFLGS